MKILKIVFVAIIAIMSIHISAFFVSSDDPGANILGGAATGALIGGIAGGGKGAGIGAGVGLGIGAMTAASRADRGYYDDGYYRDKYYRRKADRRSLREQLNDCLRDNEALRQENYELRRRTGRRW